MIGNAKRYPMAYCLGTLATLQPLDLGKPHAWFLLRPRLKMGNEKYR